MEDGIGGEGSLAPGQVEASEWPKVGRGTKGSAAAWALQVLMISEIKPIKSKN